MAIVKEVQIGDQRLILGDCISVMPTLGRFDAVVTDPPYGISYKPRAMRPGKRREHAAIYGRKEIHGDSIAPDVTGLLHLANEAIIWGGNYFADQLPPKASWLVWDKKGGNASFHGATTFADCELAWCSDGRPAMIHQQIWSGLVRQGIEASAPRCHPTQKPIALMEWCLKRLPKAKTILDPFMGSGTTLVACQRMGRHGTGIELDEGYFEIACKRVRDAYAQPDLFIAPPEKPVQEVLL